jgi:ppGpp synthetase/RelA/SpoT-type nucleotidyltranferase
MPRNRSVEDQLRAEYFDLLPNIRRAVLETETRVRSHLLGVSLNLERYERLLVTSRVKECDSAVDALRRRQPLGLFDDDRSDDYSLTQLRDLAGIRVMAFPRRRIDDAHAALLEILSLWTADPVPGVDGSNVPLARKYFGTWTPDTRITAEIQIVGLLIGSFWEVEHSAIYKPNPNLRGVVESETVIQRRNDVLAALRAFELAFEEAVSKATHGDR